MVNGNHPIKGIRKITKANVISKGKMWREVAL